MLSSHKLTPTGLILITFYTAGSYSSNSTCFTLLITTQNQKLAFMN
jgi:hypothetical protein